MRYFALVQWAISFLIALLLLAMMIGGPLVLMMLTGMQWD